MRTRRTRALITSAFLIGGVVSVAVSPVSAASCTLTAPASVAIGSTLIIEGAGFPASTAVDVSITIQGGSPDEFSAQSDAAGGFEINLMPETADEGMTTIVASAGAACSAQVVVAVGTTTGGTPEPTDAGTADTGAEPSGARPPTTDLVPASQTAPASPGGTSSLAMILLLAGIGGLLVARPARDG